MLKLRFLTGTFEVPKPAKAFGPINSKNEINKFKTHLLHKNYFKNSLEFQGFWDSQKGNIVLNNEPINQQLNNEFFRISNNLKNIFR